MINELTAKNRRVLVIDDNRAIHDDFRKILSPANATVADLDATEAAVFGASAEATGQTQTRFEIDSAYQGMEGVARVKEAFEAGHPYALAFVDVRMPPGLDGVETARKLWEIDPELQIVVCTAYSDYSWGEMFEKLGYRDGLLILKKPFDSVEAFQLAHALSEKWWLHQQSQHKMEELEKRVGERTHDLQKSNEALQTEVVKHTQALDALRASQQFIEAIINGIPVGIFWKDRNLAFLGCNAAFARDAGLNDPRDIIGKDDHQMVWRDQAELYRADDWQVIESGRPKVLIEEPHTTPEGKTRTLLTSKVPLHDSQGNVAGVIGMYMDITERKNAESALAERARLAALAADVGAALTHGFSMQKMLQGCATALVQHLDAAFARVWTLNAETNMLELEASAGMYTHLDGPHGRVPVGKFKIGLIAQERKPHLTNQVVGDPRVGDQEWAKREGMVSFAGYPLVVDNRVIGVMALFARHPLPEATLHAMAGIADGIALGIERMRSDAALRQSEERMRLQTAALGASANGVAITDFQGTIQWINQAFTNLTGYSAQEAIGQNPRILKSGKHSEAFYKELWTTIRAGKIWRKELVNRRKDGSLYDEEMTITPVRDVKGAISHFIAIKQDIGERKRIEEALRESEERFRDLFENANDLIQSVSPQGRFVYVNRAWRDTLGYTAEEVQRLTLFDVLDQSCHAHCQQMFQRLMAGEKVPHTETIFVSKQGRRINVEGTANCHFKDGQPVATRGIFRDVTERKGLEAQLFQSQKMETVGKLAGGVAHEFNSIMTAIIGQSELILTDLPAGNPLAKNATEIHKAADRAAGLTRQLLAYGRRQILQPEILNLNKIATGMETMLRQVLGSDVDLRIIPGGGLGSVKADAGQLEQVIMNLAVNARDAMQAGGKLTLETSNVTLDADSVGRYPDLKPGAYVMLAISDTGMGMTPDIKARLFEPFFSTKGVGKGTGLGLATCYGILKQSGGHITAYSEPGRGSTFKIYLPQVPIETPLPTRSAPSNLPRGSESILLVEDDPALREMASMLLNRLGYSVIEASNGLGALAIIEQRNGSPIDLLFTDVVMPEMNGKDLSDRIAALHPGMKILFTSAYTENAIVHQGVLNEGVALLQKPFTPSKLATKVREVLDAKT